MLECRGDEEIVIVSGDSLDLTISFDNLEPEIIDKVIFSSNGINCTKALSKIPNDASIFVLNINPIETKEFPIGMFDYDLTVLFKNGNVETISYRSKLKILKKTNAINLAGF